MDYKTDLKNNRECSEQEESSNSLFERSYIWVPVAIFCTMLWGSAFPSVKLGYELFNVDKENTFSILLFAGSRFALAGILTLIISVLTTKKLPSVSFKELKGVTALGLVQTGIQYTFFYVSLSHTTGVNGSIISATSGLMAVLLAAAYYRHDRMTTGKAIGCIMGLVGVIVLNLGKGKLSSSFAFNGEFFMLLASFAGAVGVLISKELTSKTDSFVVTGYQLFTGGVLLIIIGLIGGGRLNPVGGSAFVLLIYMALISCIAFGLWTTLVKYHALSKISIFQTLIPIFGSALSVIFLGEKLKISAVIALILIVSGIIILNNWDKISGNSKKFT